jgi:hypothetical protein
MNNNFEKNINYKNIVNSINNIFINSDDDISKFIYDENNIITRKSKLSYSDTLIYSLLYCQSNKTKIDIVNEFNLERNELTNIARTTFHVKSLTIPLSYYAYIYNEINDIYNNNFIDKTIPLSIAVDGTYGNTNIKNIKGNLETSLSMGFFDVNNDIPIELLFCGEEAKNNEVKLLEDYMLKNKDKFINVILILDRAYCSYEFINFCKKYKFKFVIRFKNNCINIPKTIRVIVFSEYNIEIVSNDNIEKQLINNKKFKDVTLKTNNKYTLVTNLDINDYNDEKIKTIYHQRWNIILNFQI